MLRPALAVALLFSSPLAADEGGGTLSVAALLEEAGGLAGKARAAYGPAHEKPPSVERNAALSEVRKFIKQALDKYRTAQELSPAQAKPSEAAVTDLEGMLFWCNKSMVVCIPSAPPPPPPPPSPTAGPVGPPPAPPPLPAALTEAEVKEVETILRSLYELAREVEDGQDLVDRYRQRIADTFAVLDGTQQAWEARHAAGQVAGWAAAKEYEARREYVLEKPKGYQKQIQSKMREIWTWEAQARCKRDHLAYFGERALPAIRAYAARPGTDFTEGMVDYLNRRLTSPEYAFTRVPPSSPAPEPGKLDAAKAQAARILLGDLAAAQQRVAEIGVMLADRDLESERIRKDLDDREKHFKWRQEKSTYAVYELKKNEDYRQAARKTLDKLAASKTDLSGERTALQGRIEGLRSGLGALDPSCARVVEDWRRKQTVLPDALASDLEGWTRRALGQP